MSDIIIGSARMGENNKITGGRKGDQRQAGIGKDDYCGEVSLQKFYVHKKGWKILRPKSTEHANKIARAMYDACNNPNIGYNQNERLQIVSAGTRTTTPVNSDCSSLVRRCIIEGTGKDPGNFTTSNEAVILKKSALFTEIGNYTNKTPLYIGDVLVTCTKGHTVVVVSGKARGTVQEEIYYPAFTGSTASIITALAAVGEKDTSKTHRTQIAKANNIINYSGTAAENLLMLNLLKKGLLKKCN